MRKNQTSCNFKTGFPPIESPDAQILVLGSMPGEMSLQMQQYYAHSANLFWKIMSNALKIDVNSDYLSRASALKAAHVALWDVLKHCEREGSLDSSIKKHSEQTNDIVGFLASHLLIRRICFNGQKAFAVFKKHILKFHPELQENCELVLLPSTSPANASIVYDYKCKIWSAKVWNAFAVSEN